MTTGDWFNLAALIIAVLLGAYGVCRDRGDRRDAERLRREAQARLVLVSMQDVWTMDMVEPMLIIRNDGPLTVSNLRAPTASRDDDGEPKTTVSYLGDLRPGEERMHSLHGQDPRELPHPLYVAFTDANGARWRRTVDGQLLTGDGDSADRSA
ncbi:hypothetical protein [Cellulomonas iranensis]|uniref:hypothetical protein n=1 Tax=Cellulomonas iranensis TaxID=76862 RepID=UPI000B3BFCBF|nr:hypothetical protein [Cellulomonas iranensis]